jgi:hypothetical protein
MDGFSQFGTGCSFLFNFTTRVFEEGSFRPAAKLTKDKKSLS